MHLDVSFHHGIDSFVFRSRAFDPPLSLLRKSFVPLLFGFQGSLLSHLPPQELDALRKRLAAGRLSHSETSLARA